MNSFHYVYIMESQSVPGRHYIGMTDDLTSRLAKHNAAQVPHTSKFVPWHIQTAIAFRNSSKARRFERYLKSGSGRAFSKNHF